MNLIAMARSAKVDLRSSRRKMRTKERNVAKIALVFGGLLILLGVASFVGTAAPTALIPAYFGVAIILCGAIAMKPNLRMHAMHGAAMVGTIGLLGALVMVIKALAHGIPRPVAFWCQVIMLVLCAAFIVMCVRSFIMARRNRVI